MAREEMSQVSRFMAKRPITTILAGNAIGVEFILATSPHSISEIMGAGWGAPATGTMYTITFVSLMITGLLAQISWKAREAIVDE